MVTFWVVRAEGRVWNECKLPAGPSSSEGGGVTNWEAQWRS